MATNLDIENELLEAAMHAGGHKTKKAAVTEYLAFNIAQTINPLLLQPNHCHLVHYPPTSPLHCAEQMICQVETTSLAYLQF